MPMIRRSIGAAALLFVGALTLQQCTSTSTPPAPEAAPAAPELTAVVSVRELMASLIDPLADNVFEAVAVDVTEQGVVETKPTTDEDWEKIRQGAIALAEGSNLLKIPRPVAPADDYVSKNPEELPPAEIQAIIDKNRGAWNAFADGLRQQGLAVLEIVEARDTDKLFQAGSDIDRVCESCHLTFWYPGEREAVTRARESKAFKEPVQK